MISQKVVTWEDWLRAILSPYVKSLISIPEQFDYEAIRSDFAEFLHNYLLYRIETFLDGSRREIVGNAEEISGLFIVATWRCSAHLNLAVAMKLPDEDQEQHFNLYSEKWRAVLNTHASLLSLDEDGLLLYSINSLFDYFTLHGRGSKVTFRKGSNDNCTVTIRLQHSPDYPFGSSKSQGESDTEQNIREGCTPIEINEEEYGEIFSIVLETLINRLNREEDMAALEKDIGFHLQKEIRAVTRARKHIENAKDSISDAYMWEDLYSDLEQILPEVLGWPELPKYKNRFTPHIFDDVYMAVGLGTLFADKDPYSLAMFDYILSVNPDAARIGFGMYAEALSLMLSCRHYLHPIDLAMTVVRYYTARRSADQEAVGEAKSAMIYGSGSAKGPLFKKAWQEYSSLPEIDREIAAQSYCDGFFMALDKLPVEALLSPDLAMAWALKKARWEGNKTLPQDMLIPPNENRSDYLEEEPAIPDALIERIKSARNYNLALRYRDGGMSLSEIGKEPALTGRTRAITKQAVHKRIKRFDTHVRKAQSREESALAAESMYNKLLTTDDLWSRISTMLPSKPHNMKKARQSIPERKVMAAILYKLRSGCSWHKLPLEFGKRSTIHNYYKTWQNADVFDRMRENGILQELEIQ